MTDAPPPTRVRHRIIAVTMLTAFILYLDRICMGEIVKSLSFNQELHLSKEQIGTILGAFFFSYALFQVPAGWASDRFGTRPTMTLYILLWSLFTGLTGLVSSFGGLLAARLLCGFAEAGAYPTAMAIVRRSVRGKNGRHAGPVPHHLDDSHPEQLARLALYRLRRRTRDCVDFLEHRSLHSLRASRRQLF